MKRRFIPDCANVALALVAVLLTLAVLELIVRRGDVRFENLIMKEGGPATFSADTPYPLVYDAELGWVPRSDTSTWAAHNGPDGLRSNGNDAEPRSRPLILALGDSFTYGVQVHDDDTWPAHLEKSTGYTVLNAGVPGYGLDQMILRAERLVPKYQPDVVVVSFIYDDLERSRLRLFNGAAKPYFTIADGELRLQNVPVPQPQAGLDGLRRVLGYSHLINMAMVRLDREYWWRGVTQDSQSVGGDALELQKALLRRLHATARAHQTEIVILVEPEKEVSEFCCPVLPELLAFMRSELPSFRIVDAIQPVLQMRRETPREFDSLFFPGSRAHMTSKGNAFIAALVSRPLAELGRRPGPPPRSASRVLPE